MAPTPIPAPLPPWARALIQIAPLIASYLQQSLQHLGELNPATSTVPGEWRHVQMVWRDMANLDPADYMVTTMDIANITAGTVDPSWTDADYTTVDAQISGMAGDWCARAQDRLTHVENRYYRRAFNAIDTPGDVQPDDKPFAISGPPERVFPGFGGLTGLAGVQANQVAMTSTEKTAYPKHWGRTYWPLPGGSELDSAGRWQTTALNTFGGALRTRYSNLMTAEFFPVIAVTQIQGQRARGLLTVDKLQLDNVPDVIRRRRLKTATVKSEFGLT